MNRNNQTKLLLFIISLIILQNYLFAQTVSQLSFRDTSLSLEKRVNDLLSRMTLEEKVSQMQNDAKAIPHLGIPAYNWWNECLHGVGRNGIATVFPQAIGMAATWNPELIGMEADVISTEARAKHNNAMKKKQSAIYEGLTFWSPNINIFRDPRWGRGQETYGEDPFLTSRIGVAFVKGLQGTDSTYLKVVATPKHYAVHSGPESSRHTFDARISLTDLYETYLPAFEACITEGKAYSIMGAYNRLFGVPCCASDLLLKDILRKRWGFDGYVVTDCGAIWDMFITHKVYPDAPVASAKSLKAGTDITCGNEYQSLLEAVKDSLVSEADIDRSLRRLLTARFMLGMFDPPEMVQYANIPITQNNTPEHSALARKVARESIVLLKNEKNLLPLKKDKLRSIAVIGPYADNIDVLLGNYNGMPSQPITILQGIRKATTGKVKIEYCQGVAPLEQSAMLEPIDGKYLLPPDGVSGKGLLAEYFNNPTLNGKPVATSLDSVIDHNWLDASPLPELPKDSFSIRWNGKLVIPNSGVYKIGLSTDDKGKLMLDGNVVIDNWDSAKVNSMKTFQTELTKGKEYPITLEFAELSDFARISLQWKRVKSDEEKNAEIAEAVTMSKETDVTVVVAGISPRLEGEEMPVELEGFKGGDRTTLDLPADQRKLLQALSETGKPIVLVLTNGSAISISWEKEHLPVILEAWYPGQQGGNAIADLLFGKQNPAGRLPITFYKSVSDLPAFDDYDMQGRTYRYFKGEPLYPFGHGLSYTKFDYLKVEVDKPDYKPADTITVSVTIKNTGRIAGDEVIQVYVRRPNPKSVDPVKSLVGFRRIFVPRRSQMIVSIPVPVSLLRRYDSVKKDYIVKPGSYELQVGASSADIRLKNQITVIK